MRTRQAAAALGAAIFGVALIAAACTTMGRGPGRQAANGAGRACFYARNISSWAPAGDRVVNLRVGVSDYYQLQLLAECSDVDWTEHIGLEHQGSDWICSGLDATLIVPTGTGIGPRRCAVSSLRKLAPAEVAALPPRQKP